MKTFIDLGAKTRFSDPKFVEARFLQAERDIRYTSKSVRQIQYKADL